MLVSIIMPFKNAAAFLKLTVQSIINQSYPHWELIAVNDHSSDDSVSILQNFKHPKIKILNNPEKGIISALQTGYIHSNGSYITRMDADDLMTENKLELMVHALFEKGEGNLVVGLVKYFSEDNLGNGYIKYEQWLNKLTNNCANFREIYKECPIPSPNWMVHRDDFEKCDAFNSEIYPEDYDLAFRFYKSNLNIIGIQEVTHFWRDHPKRTSRNDENYRDNRFLSLKLNYFLDLDYSSQKRLVLWGAGKKGKAIAKHLSDQRIKFEWICNNTSKIGKSIYNIPLKDSTTFDQNNCQVIVAVAGHENQLEIKTQLEHKINTESYYFC